jgi:hypothetical protein
VNRCPQRGLAAGSRWAIRFWGRNRAMAAAPKRSSASSATSCCGRCSCAA